MALGFSLKGPLRRRNQPHDRITDNHPPGQRGKEQGNCNKYHLKIVPRGNLSEGDGTVVRKLENELAGTEPNEHDGKNDHKTEKQIPRALPPLRSYSCFAEPGDYFVHGFSALTQNHQPVHRNSNAAHAPPRSANKSIRMLDRESHDPRRYQMPKSRPDPRSLVPT